MKCIRFVRLASALLVFTGVKPSNLKTAFHPMNTKQISSHGVIYLRKCEFFKQIQQFSILQIDL